MCCNRKLLFKALQCREMCICYNVYLLHNNSLSFRFNASIENLSSRLSKDEMHKLKYLSDPHDHYVTFYVAY